MEAAFTMKSKLKVAAMIGIGLRKNVFLVQIIGS